MQGNKPVDRRTVMKAAGGTGLAALAGVLYLSDSAQAVEVDVNELEIDDQEVSPASQPDELPLTLEGEYRVESNVTPDRLRLIPRVKVESGAMDWHEYEGTDVDLEEKNASGDVELEHDLLALADLRDVWPDSEDESETRNLAVELLAAVYDDDEQIGTAEAKQTFVLKLTHESATASIGLAMTGSVTAE